MCQISSTYFNIIFEDLVVSFEGLAILIYEVRGDLKCREVFCMEVADKLITLVTNTTSSTVHNMACTGTSSPSSTNCSNNMHIS
jgi:hypothetical protein